jgi:UDP-N-acetylmuramoyl-L-alanyl-D-glutamate--2,6-diaminopimelate ligase
MTLTALLEILYEEFPDLPALRGGTVSVVTSNSEDVRPESVFVAIPGTKVDGHTFIESAKANGARLMIGERDGAEFGLTNEEYLRVPDARLALGLLASQFEGNPSREMQVIGITGTSGKTTTSFIVEAILRAAGMSVGLIGTVAYRIDGREIPSTHTTPGPVELHRLLREMRKAGCGAVVMEVSSHALKQHRTAGLAFDGVAFTNLSPEHLDYHPDMDDYFRSKRILFHEQADRSRRWKKIPSLVVHFGNPEGDRLLAETPAASGFRVEPATKIDASGIRGIFSGLGIESPLIGRFNAENIAAAVAVTKAIGIPDAAIVVGVESLSRVPGRLERVSDRKGGRVILIDYAHKPDALEKVLNVLRPMRKSGARLITVVGCGGDRDRTKRPVMGEIACRLSDWVVFTSDNPRTENPAAILAEVASGARDFKNHETEIDRKKAIFKAIRGSNADDIVLIAGKGHEDYQILGTEKIRFDDREVAASALG